MDNNNNTNGSTGSSTTRVDEEAAAFGTGAVPLLWLLNIICNVLIDLVITAFVALRVYVHSSSRVRFQLEDWMCLSAWVLTIIYTMPLFAMSFYGAGYRLSAISADAFMGFKKVAYAAGATYSPAAITTKTTLLLMTARAFASVAQPGVRRGIHAFIGLLVLLFLPIQVCKLAICAPVAAFWDDGIERKRCLNQGILFLCDSTVAVVSDLVILALPVGLTWSLRVPTEMKLKISLLLGTGGIAVGLTAYRLYKSWIYAQSTDPAVDYVPIALLSTGELSIGIVCACLPSLHILLERRKSKKHVSGSNKPIHPKKGGGGGGSSGGRRSSSVISGQTSRGSTKVVSWLSSKVSTINNTTTTTTAVAAWDQVTTTTTTTTTTTRGAIPDTYHPNLTTATPATATAIMVQTNVDVELGTITETVGEEEMDITRGQGLSGRSRVMSIDGRREGWLAPGYTVTEEELDQAQEREGEGEGRGLEETRQHQHQHQQQHRHRHHHHQRIGLFGRRKKTIASSDVMCVGESDSRRSQLEQWDFIWDGTRTAFTDSRLQDLRHQMPPLPGRDSAWGAGSPRDAP